MMHDYSPFVGAAEPPLLMPKRYCSLLLLVMASGAMANNVPGEPSAEEAWLPDLGLPWWAYAAYVAVTIAFGVLPRTSNWRWAVHTCRVIVWVAPLVLITMWFVGSPGDL